MLLRRVLSFFSVLAIAAHCVAPPCPANTTADDMLASHNLTGKVAVITGGDSGLGFAMAGTLGKRGASLIISGRNATKLQEAAANLTDATGAKVSAFTLDLASLASVREFAGRVLGAASSLNFLVNNAGIGGPSVMSKDGFELVFEVDYLGHFLLTELLLPALRSGGGPARIVNVASGAHENACEVAGLPEGCFKDWTYLPPPVVPVKNVTEHTALGPVVTKSSSYGIAKFLNTQHAAALAQRESVAGVEAYSITPGFALTSMTSGFDSSSPEMKMICEGQVHPSASLPANPCPFSAGQGAAVIAYCLAGDAPTSGAYYSRTLACEEKPITMHGFTESMQLELYERSLSWVGLSSGSESLQYV